MVAISPSSPADARYIGDYQWTARYLAPNDRGLVTATKDTKVLLCSTQVSLLLPWCRFNIPRGTLAEIPWSPTSPNPLGWRFHCLHTWHCNWWNLASLTTTPNFIIVPTLPKTTKSFWQFCCPGQGTSLFQGHHCESCYYYQVARSPVVKGTLPRWLQWLPEPMSSTAVVSLYAWTRVVTLIWSIGASLYWNELLIMGPRVWHWTSCESSLDESYNTIGMVKNASWSVTGYRILVILNNFYGCQFNSRNDFPNNPRNSIFH